MIIMKVRGEVGIISIRQNIDKKKNPKCMRRKNHLKNGKNEKIRYLILKILQYCLEMNQRHQVQRKEFHIQNIVNVQHHYY